VISKLRSAVDSLGAVNAVLYGANRVASRLGLPLRVHPYRFFAQPVLADPVCPATLGRTIEVREIPRDDPVFSDMPVPAETIAFRFDQPTICIGAFRDRELLAYLWLCLGPYEEDEVRCRFVPLPADRVVWDFDVYVFPKHRLGPAFSRLWDGAYAYLRERGIEWTVGRISALNPRSLHVHRRLGARALGAAWYFHLGRLQIMVSTHRPGFHASVRSEGRPTIELGCGARGPDAS
jgi:hypothetical protein